MEIYITLGVVAVLFIAFFFYIRYYVSTSITQKYIERETELSKKIDTIFNKYLGTYKRKNKKEQKEMRDDSLEDPGEISNKDE